jgi:hypothetical protein
MRKWLLLLAVLVGVGLLATRNLWRAGPPERQAPPPPATQQAAGCVDAPRFRNAARANASTLSTLPWSPFGVAEAGWDAYAPVIAAEIGTTCAADSAGFAGALAAWQQSHGLPPGGILEPQTFEKMRVAWMLRRPFVIETRDGHCPPGPDEASLALAAKDEGYWGKAIQLKPGALEAWRRLRAAARREIPAVAADPQLLSLVSGYRSPSENVARCLKGGCGGPARANCSAHQTGTALDLYLGSAPGFDPTSSTDVNRSWQAATPLYSWLAANAGRFGFVGYPYEPWHWEWAGEPASG